LNVDDIWPLLQVNVDLLLLSHPLIRNSFFKVGFLGERVGKVDWNHPSCVGGRSDIGVEIKSESKNGKQLDSTQSVRDRELETERQRESQRQRDREGKRIKVRLKS